MQHTFHCGILQKNGYRGDKKRNNKMLYQMFKSCAVLCHLSIMHYTCLKDFRSLHEFLFVKTPTTIIIIIWCIGTPILCCFFRVIIGSFKSFIRQPSSCFDRQITSVIKATKRGNVSFS